MNRKKLYILIIIAIIAIGSVIYLIIPKEVHEHADFAVYVNGERLNLSDDKYMHHEEPNETHEGELEDDEKAHMHDNIGWIVHKHSADATWGIFLKNINASFNSTCFVFERGLYCNNETHKLRMFVNGKENMEFEKLPIRDLDRVLISFDKIDANLTSKITQITDEACIYSKKCPERGEAGSEECTTGGTQCV